MKEVDLLLNPYWKAKDLGRALPQSPHAVSVSLPTWADVVAYEEGDPKCIEALNSIYPRFGFNSFVEKVSEQALAKFGNKDWTAWPYPDFICAKKAQSHCSKVDSYCSTEILKFLGLVFLLADQRASPLAKSFWQHTGLGASSRQAAIALQIELPPSLSSGINATEILRKRLSNIYQCDHSFISLHPSGMAALTAAIEITNKIRPGRPTIQIGFPYVDVLKLPQIIFNGGILLEETNPTYIEKQLDQHKPAAVIVEIPSNPMLKCIDIPIIADLAHKRNIPVIADDTIGSPLNVNVIDYVDMIFSSLTKSFAGNGNIMAGSLLISPSSPWRKELIELLCNNQSPNLSAADSIALEKSSRNVIERLHALNKACISLKRRLENHPSVLNVFHPELCPNFQKIMRGSKSGYGCLLSFELCEGIEKAKRVYDSLKVCKGPSFGTNFTLVAPYVLLAHYKELSWAERCGVPSHLLRVSVGLEEEENLWGRFEKALSA